MMFRCKICNSLFEGERCKYCGEPAPKDSSQKVRRIKIRIPELEKPENARWLALLIDTEGSLGWVSFISRTAKIDEVYRYVYHYQKLYISIGMDEKESRATIREASKIMLTESYLTSKKVDTAVKLARRVTVDAGKALAVMRYCLPYFDKHRRLAPLCLTLFKHHAYLRKETSDRVITELFGVYLKLTEVNSKLLDMTEKQFNNFIKKADALANKYLT